MALFADQLMMIHEYTIRKEKQYYLRILVPFARMYLQHQ